MWGMRFAIAAISIALAVTLGGPDRERSEDLALFNLLFDELYNAGKYNDALVVAETAADVTRREKGRHHPDTATSLTRLAETYRQLGRYADAELHHKDSLSIREKTLGPENPDLANLSTTSPCCMSLKHVTRRLSRCSSALLPFSIERARPTVWSP